MATDDDSGKKFVAWASQATVERYHTETKAMAAQQNQHLHEHDKQIQELQFEVKSHKESLNNGAATFTRWAERIERVEASLRPSIKTVLGFGILAAGWIWTLAHFPDPAQFEAVRRDVQVQQVQLEKLETKLGNIADQQDKIEGKLDRALTTAHPAP